MNTKSLAILAVIVALLMGWLLVNLSTAPAESDVEPNFQVDVEEPRTSDGETTNEVETSVNVDPGVVETSVEVVD